jgi:integrase
MKLTAQALAKYRWPDKPDHIIFDDDIAGFGLRTRKGKRSWVFQYAFGSGAAKVTRRIKIGDYPALSPAKAREEAEDLHAKVHLHGDPALERRKNRIEAGKTFGKLVEQYLAARVSELRPRSYAEVRRHLVVSARSLHNMPLGSVDQSAVVACLNTTAKRGPVAANRARASLSAMFAWAMGEGLALVNPVAHTNKREERPRDRVLSDAELRVVWEALRDDDYGVIVKLLMLTGQRANEMAALSWSEVDLDRGLISLPGTRTKNGRPHDTPMTDTVRSLLASRPKRGDRDLIFGRSTGPFSGWTDAKQALNERAPLKPWVIHDLRRSVATGMADIGVQPHIIEAVLNHVSGHKGGIAGIYNRASYAKEKAEALARWDEHIGAVVGLRGRR